VRGTEEEGLPTDYGPPMGIGPGTTLEVSNVQFRYTAIVTTFPNAQIDRYTRSVESTAVKSAR
jgi:hypothetical protein